jgi:hypothetical protein
MNYVKMGRQGFFNFHIKGRVLRHLAGFYRKKGFDLKKGGTVNFKTMSESLFVWSKKYIGENS